MTHPWHIALDHCCAIPPTSRAPTKYNEEIDAQKGTQRTRTRWNIGVMPATCYRTPARESIQVRLPSPNRTHLRHVSSWRATPHYVMHDRACAGDRSRHKWVHHLATTTIRRAPQSHTRCATSACHPNGADMVRGGSLAGSSMDWRAEVSKCTEGAHGTHKRSAQPFVSSRTRLGTQPGATVGHLRTWSRAFSHPREYITSEENQSKRTRPLSLTSLTHTQALETSSQTFIVSSS